MAVRGQIARHGTPARDAETTLERLLDDEEARLAVVWPPPAPNLRSVFPPLIWRRKRRVVLDLAESYLSGAVPRVQESVPVGPRSPKDLPSAGRWCELRIEVPELRLAGRADLVDLEPGKVTIRDLKTGRVVTDDAKILPHIECQMRLYGIMARRIWPNAEVQLVVDDGNERAISFEDTDAEELLGWLNASVLSLPVETTVSAGALATPGEACEGCSFRHVCPAYRSVAPQFWTGSASVRMPLDTWGNIEIIVQRPNGLCDIALTDAAHRRVKVFGLLDARMSALSPGQSLWLFGLRTRDRRGSADSWRHPLNFFEVTDDDPFGRAWTLETFAGPTDVASRPL
jgi:hypothetical protein